MLAIRWCAVLTSSGTFAGEEATTDYRIAQMQDSREMADKYPTIDATSYNYSFLSGNLAITWNHFSRSCQLDTAARALCDAPHLWWCVLCADWCEREREREREKSERSFLVVWIIFDWCLVLTKIHVSSFIDGYVEVKEVIYTNILLAILAVLFITAILLGNILAAFLVGIMVTMIDIEVLMMWYTFGDTWNYVTGINLILGVGLSVDPLAHVTHSFLRTSGTGDERASRSQQSQSQSDIPSLPCPLNSQLSSFSSFFGPRQGGSSNFRSRSLALSLFVVC